MVLALVALVIIGLVIWQANPGGIAGPRGGQDTNTASPTVSAWNETSSASPSDSPTPSDPPASTSGSAVPCPDTDPGSGGTVVGGRLQSGGLSAATIDSWEPPADRFYLAGVTDMISQQKQIAPAWESSSAVGAVSTTDFANPQLAARGLTQCFASSGYYRNFKGLKTIQEEAVTIDGRSGYRISTEVYVDGYGPDITGDVIDVIVVDTGIPGTLGVYISSVTIGDATTQAQVDAVVADLKVAT